MDTDTPTGPQGGSVPAADQIAAWMIADETLRDAVFECLKADLQRRIASLGPVPEWAQLLPGVSPTRGE
jgi:hypothetical protein